MSLPFTDADDDENGNLDYEEQDDAYMDDNVILEDGEVPEAAADDQVDVALFPPRRRCQQPLSESRAKDVAAEFNASLDVVYETFKRGHDMNAESLAWMALAIKYDIPRAAKQSFQDWKETVAKLAHIRNDPHPWDRLERFRSLPQDARCGAV